MNDDTLILLNRARADDREALEALFERYHQPLRRALRRLVGDDYRARVADSEDAAQDAVLSAFQGLESFEYRGQGSFLAWLVKRAEHALLNRVRDARRLRRDPGKVAPMEAALDAVDQAQSVAGPARHTEMREALRLALDELPERERDVILLRQFCELPSEEICEELGLPSASAVRNLHARAQARLAIVLSSHGHSADSL